MKNIKPEYLIWTHSPVKKKMKRKKKSCFWNPHDIETQEIKKKKRTMKH